MNKPKINKIVIAGGGTAGWMVAAALSKVLGTALYDIDLVESDEIGTVGVGEATIPMIQLYLKLLGINESEFLKETNGTFKLGIEFVDWRAKGESYFHPFGSIGKVLGGVDFIHFWLRLKSMGGGHDFGLFSAETLAARANKFAVVDNSQRPDLAPINYAYHFDAGLFAQYLRKFAEDRGVKRIEGRINSVEQNNDSGYVESLILENSRRINGHLFIDCTGFKSLLLAETLNVSFESWKHWLPCNSAVAAPSTSLDEELTPYTRSIAKDAGWQWRIPLQHRIGNGYVYSDEYLKDEDATNALVSSLDGTLLKEPKTIKFSTGHRKAIWEKNVIGIGLSGGFLEPLESTAIHLVQSTISKLLAFFPKDEIHKKVVDNFNIELISEYENIRDFLIAHYFVTERQDTEFWQYCKNMDIPDSLRNRIDIFNATGNTNPRHHELFKENSWFAVLAGQGLTPSSYHPIADVAAEEEFRINLSRVRASISGRVDTLPNHEKFLNSYCFRINKN